MHRYNILRPVGLTVLAQINLTMLTAGGVGQTSQTSTDHSSICETNNDITMLQNHNFCYNYDIVIINCTHYNRQL